VRRIEIRSEAWGERPPSLFAIQDRDWRYIEPPERAAAGLDEGSCAR